MRRSTRSLVWVFLSVLILLWLLAISLPVVYADGDCKGHSCNEGGGDVTVDTQVDVGLQADTHNTISNSNSQGNINAGSDRYSSRALALSNSIGDVDINDCIVTKQDGTPLYSRQRFEYNLWCMSERLDGWGLHDEAAEVRCEIKQLAEIFGDECTARLRNPGGVIAVPERALREHQLEEEEHERELREVRQELAQLRELQLEQAQQRQVTRVVVDPELKQRLDADARRRAKAAEILLKVQGEE